MAKIVCPQNDPFARFQFPLEWQDASNQVFLKFFGLSKMAVHLHEVIGAFIFYETVYLASSLLSPLIVKSYKQLSPKTKVGFDIHVVSEVQALLIMGLTVPLYWDDHLMENPVLGYTPYAGFCYAMAAGYFAWDTYICFKYMNMFGPGFALHGLAAFIVFSLSLKPYIMGFGPTFLLFELSTPFVNVNWFATHLPEGTIPFWVQVINGLLLMAVFFSVRIVWGFYSIYQLALQMWIARKESGLLPPIIVLTSNMSLNCLNLFWFSKMIEVAKHRILKVEAQDSKKTK